MPIIENPPGEKSYKEQNPDISHRSSADGKHINLHNVFTEAIAKVDVIRDKALSLGWTENGLYQTQGRFRYPSGEEYGLVCFVGKNEIIGEVTRKYIEIIRPSGVRQKYYNRDVDQLWIKKAS